MNMITFLKEEFKVFNLLKTNSFNRLSVNVYFLHFSSFFCFLLFLLPAISIAQKNKPDTLYADFISQKIKRDGILNEEVWQKAHRISNFQQREPEEGKPVSEKTEVAFLYNDNTLYIGLWGFDSHPEKILAKDMARDGRWGTSDNFEIVISTFNDNRNAYLFVVNPNGARGDAIISDEGNGWNEDWNGVWDVSVTRTDSGWFAELEIPFSTMKFKNHESHIWGLNIERNIRWKKEQASWQGWSRDYSVFNISQGGTLAGLNNIKSKQLAEIKPFITSGFMKQPSDDVDKTLKVGGDINIHFSPTTKLNLTVNTDFSQVESDRVPVNLSRYSVYMPEKREFFIESKDLFGFTIAGGTEGFYSRQIGIFQGSEIPIIGGVKLAGKEKGTNFGILSLQTASKDSIPSVNYTVIRVKQDISNKSNIGIISTAKNEKGHYNYMYGADFNYITSSVFKNKYLMLGGKIAQSQTKSEDSKKNIAYQAYLSYPNDFINYYFVTSTAQDGFNPEIGFRQRGNYNMYYSTLEFKPRPKWIPWVRQLSFKPMDVIYYLSDNTKIVENAQYVIRPLGIRTKSGEWFEFNIQRDFDNMPYDFNIFDNIIIPKGEYWYNHYELQFDTYESRKFYLGTYLNWGDFYNGKRTKTYIDAKWYPNKHFNITADWTRNDIQLPQGNFITHEFGSRVEYAFTPKLNNSIYGQWNNLSEEILLNYRINWIPKVGSDFYFVINQRIKTKGNTIEFGDFTLLAKFIWRLSI
jgi:hypothetical protein